MNTGTSTLNRLLSTIVPVETKPFLIHTDACHLWSEIDKGMAKIVPRTAPTTWLSRTLYDHNW